MDAMMLWIKNKVKEITLQTKKMAIQQVSRSPSPYPAG